MSRPFVRDGMDDEFLTIEIARAKPFLIGNGAACRLPLERDVHLVCRRRAGDHKTMVSVVPA